METFRVMVASWIVRCLNWFYVASTRFLLTGSSMVKGKKGSLCKRHGLEVESRNKDKMFNLYHEVVDR